MAQMRLVLAVLTLAGPALVGAFLPAATIFQRAQRLNLRGSSSGRAQRRLLWTASAEPASTTVRHAHKTHGTHRAATALSATACEADEYPDWETGGTDYGATLCVLSLTCVSNQDASFGMDVEVLTELIMENGALSVVVEDADYGTANERPIFDEPDAAEAESWFRSPSGESGDNLNFWSHCNVTAYFTKDYDIPGTVEMVSAAMGLPVLPRYSVDMIADRDWVKEVQRGWTPILIDDLVLRFPWHSGADIDAHLASQSVTTNARYQLALEGGMAFGTGEHATTHLCCSWLRQQLAQGRAAGARVMDYGSGSGVLGLAALVFGAGEATGVEIDPDSITAAHSNAALNNLGSSFRCYLPAQSAGASTAAADVALAQKIRDPSGMASAMGATSLPSDCNNYDLVVANILAGPLVRLAPEIARLCRPDGQMALSGILAPQADMIIEAYSLYFDDVKVEDEDRGWILVTGKRK